jgi:feruloyl esterase
MILCFAGLTFASRAQAQTTPDPAAAKCAALQSADLMHIPDAPTRIISAKAVAASDTIPAHCDVQATVNGTVEIEMKLPVEGWNGKFAHAGSRYSHVGCEGASCGSAFTAAECDNIVVRGYACLADDEGYKGTELDFSALAGNPNAKIDFAFRATHLSTLAGKEIASKYYGKAPTHSYFMGCSTAGRQAMVEAQKFPTDYDGIIAGAPPLRFAENLLTVLWSTAATQGPDGKTLFPAEPHKRYQQADMKLMHEWGLDQCDMIDGVKDMMFPGPDLCQRDMTKIQCKGPKQDGCLSAEQIASFNRIFRGPVNAKGESLTDLHAVIGSDGNWAYNYTAEGGGTENMDAQRENLFRFLDLGNDLSSQDGKIDWETAFQRIALQSAMFDATNPDLRRFKANGGKLIVFHGWGDSEVFQQNSIDYYNAVTKTMGGAGPTKEFFRLFLLPAVDHCGNGVSANRVDYITALEEWVEKSKAPDVLIAYKVPFVPGGKANIWPATSGFWQPKPFDKANSVASRPIYTYPIWAKYKGSGDTNDAANWGPVQPKS